MSKIKATKLPDLNKEVPLELKGTIPDLAKKIDSPKAFYDVLELLFKRHRTNVKDDSEFMVFIGDCYKPLLQACRTYVVHPVGDTYAFHAGDAFKLATECRGIKSLLHHTGGNFFKATKNNMVLQIFLAKD